MRVLVDVTLQLSCAGTHLDVEAELEMWADVLSYTPAEPAGPEHAPVSEQWEVELTLCDAVTLEEVEVFEAGQIFDADEKQMEAVINQLREGAATP